jgi:hypothetical protein
MGKQIEGCDVIAAGQLRRLLLASMMNFNKVSAEVTNAAT